MIQDENDIELHPSIIDETQNQNPSRYYFVLKLQSLKRLKRRQVKSKYAKPRTVNAASLQKQNESHLKFIIEQEDYIIDQTTDKIQNSLKYTNNCLNQNDSLSLEDKLLHFYVDGIQQNKSEFQLKLYEVTNQEVKEIGAMNLSALIYIEIFLDSHKNVYQQTCSLSREYSLQYQLFVQRDEAGLSQLLSKHQNNSGMHKHAFKRKGSEVIEIDESRVIIKKRNMSPTQKNLLKRAIQVDMRKLRQIHRRRAEDQIRDSSVSSDRSFFEKIGSLILTRRSLAGAGTPSPQKQLSHSRQSDVSMHVKVPKVQAPKYNLPQPRSYYFKLQNQRQRQKERVQKHLQTRPEPTKKDAHFFQIFKFTVLLAIFIALLYVLMMPKRKKGWIFEVQSMF